MKKLGILIVLALVSLAFAGTGGLAGFQTGLGTVCSQLKLVLPVAAMLMIIAAGVIYATGQIMGAETRARANVWATACLTGALMAILIVVIAPAVFDLVAGTTMNPVSTACP